MQSLMKVFLREGTRLQKPMRGVKSRCGRDGSQEEGRRGQAGSDQRAPGRRSFPCLHLQFSSNHGSFFFIFLFQARPGPECPHQRHPGEGLPAALSPRDHGRMGPKF